MDNGLVSACFRSNNVLLCLVIILVSMEDGLVHMVYADEVSGNVLILIVVDKGLVPFTYAVNYSETWVS